MDVYTWILCPDAGLYIGITTRQLLNWLEDGGDISPTQVRVLYQAVHAFYYTAAKYALVNLPLKDAVLQNMCFLDFMKRETALFSQLDFFSSKGIY